MKKTLIILFLFSAFTTMKAQQKSWAVDSLLYDLKNHHNTVFTEYQRTTFGLLFKSPLERWETVEEYYDSRKKKIKSQYIVLNGRTYGFEKRFSKKGDITHVFDHESGKQIFGVELSYSKYRESARIKADSIVQMMFPDSFYFNHVPFCSNCIFIDYYVKSHPIVESANYFDHIKSKPVGIRFYYPFVFKNGLSFDSQVRIEMDSSYKVVSSWPDYKILRDYDFKIDYSEACELAEKHDYSTTTNIDIIELDNLPGLKFNGVDYEWYFKKLNSCEKDGNTTLKKGTYLIINARNGNVKFEDYESIEIHCD